MTVIKHIRKNIKDIWWNSYMTHGADFSQNKHDIPYCPTTSENIPPILITYKEAKEIYHKEMRKGNKFFSHLAYVCFYEDDAEFDFVFGIWFRSSHAYKILFHFSGIITPDYSAYQDFPYPFKLWNTYGMRAFGYWYGVICGQNVVNNVRWGTLEIYDYSFDGIPKSSIVAIGTVGGSPKKLIDRKRFEDGFFEMVKRLSPHTIIVYGSANYPCFEKLKEQGINIVSYPSKTAKAFESRKAV